MRGPLSWPWQSENQRAEFFGHWGRIQVGMENPKSDLTTRVSITTAENLVVRLGLRRCVPFLMMARCWLDGLDGRPVDDAELRRAYEMCQESGVTFLGPWVLSILARLTKMPETRGWAIGEGERVLTEQTCVSHNYIHFYRHAIESLLNDLRWPEVEHYARKLEEYTRSEPLLICNFFISRARALTAYGHGERGSALVRELQRLEEEGERMALRNDLSALRDALNATRHEDHDGH